MDRVAEATAVVRRFAPDFKVVEKSKSRFHRAVGKLFSLFGNKDYMDDFWTTLGSTTYSPARLGRSPWVAVFHEGWHSLQNRKWTKLLFSAGYLIPQLIGILGVLWLPLAAVLGIWSPWYLLGLLALAPLPAPFRAYIEFQAYVITMHCDWTYWGGMSKKVQARYIDGFLVKKFIGSDYYWMWPFKAMLCRRFQKIFKDLETGAVPKHQKAYLAAAKALALKYRKEDGL